MLGFKYAVDTSDFDTNFVASRASPSPCSDGTSRSGILFAALLFAGLQVGTSSRNLDPEVFQPALASDLSTMIQALVIFFVGADAPDHLHLAAAVATSGCGRPLTEEPVQS